MSDKRIELKQSLDIDYMKILYEDECVSIVETLLLHEGVNRNKSNLTHDVVVAALPSLANKPLWGIPNQTIFKDSATDFVEHARTESDENNIMIFGVFPESGVNKAEFVDIDGKTYLKVQAVLWKMYAPIAMSILENRDGNAKISIEISVCGSQDDDGILNVEEMKFLSAVALGAKIPEGIEGSSLNIIRYSLDKTIAESKEHYLHFSQDNQIKYKIPELVKVNSKNGIVLKNNLGNSGVSTGLAMANFIVDNEYITKDKFNNLKDYFEKHKYSKEENINWLLRGGNEANEWIKEVNSLAEDNKKIESKEKFVSKDEIGSKSKITIDKSKDSLSDGEWSDKGIRSACLEAFNWKTVCKAVFLKLEEGWEDGTESKLGYPVMEKSGDKVVYNRKGLASAKGYAEKNNETAVLTSLKAIYKHLELVWDEDSKNSDNELQKNSTEEKIKKEVDDKTMKNKAIEKFSLTSNQMYDILGNALSGITYKSGDYDCHKYWVSDYDESVVYVYDCEEGKDFAMTYTIENEVATIDESTKKEVINGGWKVVGTIIETNAEDVVKEEDKNTEATKSDVDDVEDFKAKYDALVTECDAMKNKLAEYAKVEEEAKMSELLNTYAHCYSADEKVEAEKLIKNSSFEDFEKSVNTQAIKFALKMKDASVKPEDKTDKEEIKESKDVKSDDKKEKDGTEKNALKFSVSPFGLTPTYDFAKHSETGLSGIIENSGVNI